MRRVRGFVTQRRVRPGSAPSRSVSQRRERNLTRVRDNFSLLFLVAATQQVRGNPGFLSRLDSGLGPRPRCTRCAPLARTTRLGSRRGLASANRPSRTRNLIARRLTPLRLRYGTLDLAGPKHTPCLRRDARMVATSPPARVVTCVPLPPESLSDRNRDRTRTARVFGPTLGPARRSRGSQRCTRRRPGRPSSVSRAVARQ